MDQTKEQLIEEVIESYYAYVVKIENGCKSIIQTIEEEDEELAFHYLSFLGEGLTWIIETEALLTSNLFESKSHITEILTKVDTLNCALCVRRK